MKVKEKKDDEGLWFQSDESIFLNIFAAIGKDNSVEGYMKFA